MFAGFFSFPVIVARFPGLVCNNEARRQVPNARHRVPSLIRRLAKRVLDLSTLKTEVVRPSGFGKKTQSTNSGLFFLHWIKRHKRKSELSRGCPDVEGALFPLHRSVCGGQFNRIVHGVESPPLGFLHCVLAPPLEKQSVNIDGVNSPIMVCFGVRIYGATSCCLCLWTCSDQIVWRSNCATGPTVVNIMSASRPDRDCPDSCKRCGD